VPSTILRYSIVADSSESTGLKWAAAAAGGGLTLITPSSVANSGGSCSTSAGVTTASGCNSFSINGVFSSTYVNYMIEYNELNTSGSGVQSLWRLRASGTDNTSSTYNMASTRVSFGGGAPAGYSDNNASQWTFAVNCSTAKVGAPIFVNSPNVAVNTTFTSVYSGGDNAGYTGGYHNTASAFDGFSIYPSSGTISAIFRVYGISN
jgi:hypothetical protein